MRCRNCGAAFTESMSRCAQCGAPTGMDDERKPEPALSSRGASSRSQGVPVIPIALGALSAVLVFILIAGSIWTFLLVRERDEQISERNDAIAQRDQAITDLSDANQAFQEELELVTAERDELVSERDGLITERDDLSTDLSDLTERASTLESDIAQMEEDRAGLEDTLAELEGEIEENERLLGQSRQETTDQQTRADDAEALSAFLVDIILIDEEIQAEYVVLLNYVIEAWDYYDSNMTVNGDIAMLNALDAADRLDLLFEERQLLIDSF